MTITPAPSYRNTRQNYYTDKASDNHPLGAIVNTFKAITDVYDNQYTPLTAYTAVSGNANTPTNPEYQYPGYLYCDGSEYEISDLAMIMVELQDQVLILLMVVVDTAVEVDQQSTHRSVLRVILKHIMHQFCLHRQKMMQ